MATPQKLLAGILLALTLCGCSKSPPTNEARSAIEDWLNCKYFAKGLTLVSFKKTNGQQGHIQNDMGVSVPSYSFEYQAELQATELCAVQPEDYTKGKVYSCLSTDKDFSSLTNFCRILNVGEELQISGVMIFEKTDSGWRPTRINNHIY